MSDALADLTTAVGLLGLLLRRSIGTATVEEIVDWLLQDERLRQYIRERLSSLD